MYHGLYEEHTKEKSVCGDVQKSENRKIKHDALTYNSLKYVEISRERSNSGNTVIRPIFERHNSR